MSVFFLNNNVQIGLSALQLRVSRSDLTRPSVVNCSINNTLILKFLVAQPGGRTSAREIGYLLICCCLNHLRDMQDLGEPRDLIVCRGAQRKV